MYFFYIIIITFYEFYYSKVFLDSHPKRYDFYSSFTVCGNERGLVRPTNCAHEVVPRVVISRGTFHIIPGVSNDTVATGAEKFLLYTNNSFVSEPQATDFPSDDAANPTKFFLFT